MQAQAPRCLCRARDGNSCSSFSSSSCPPACWGWGFPSLEVPGSWHAALEASSLGQRVTGTEGMEELAPPGTHLEPAWVSGDHSRATKTTVGPPVIKLEPTQGQLRKAELSQCHQCPCWDHLWSNWDQLGQSGLSQSQQRLHWGHLWTNWDHLEPQWDNQSYARTSHYHTMTINGQTGAAPGPSGPTRATLGARATTLGPSMAQLGPTGVTLV